MEFDRDHENSEPKVLVDSPLPTESPTSLKSEDDIDAGIAILNPSVSFDYKRLSKSDKNTKMLKFNELISSLKGTNR